MVDTYPGISSEKLKSIYPNKLNIINEMEEIGCFLVDKHYDQTRYEISTEGRMFAYYIKTGKMKPTIIDIIILFMECMAKKFSEIKKIILSRMPSNFIKKQGKIAGNKLSWRKSSSKALIHIKKIIAPLYGSYEPDLKQIAENRNQRIDVGYILINVN